LCGKIHTSGIKSVAGLVYLKVKRESVKLRGTEPMECPLMRERILGKEYIWGEKS